jgi:hypothetical protein
MWVTILFDSNPMSGVWTSRMKVYEEKKEFAL